jgi:hypothetical protein
MALVQLDRISTLHPVPFLLMNYDGFFDKLLAWLEDMEGYGGTLLLPAAAAAACCCCCCCWTQ